MADSAITELSCWSGMFVSVSPGNGPI